MAPISLSNPLISVIMATHNAAKTLVEALNSLTGQTYSNFVAHIIDDASTDETWDLLQSHIAADPRFKIYRNTENFGLATSLNLCLEQVTTPYVVRMDADDIALPQRLKVQLGFMEQHPKVDVCGTWVNLFGDREGCYTPPVAHDAIAAELLFGNPMAHPTVIMRTDVLRAVPYDSSFTRAQDYELWSRMLFDHDVHFANIPEVLLRYRTHDSNFFRPWHIQVLRYNLERIGVEPTEDELALHTALSLRQVTVIQKKYTPLQVALWCNKLHLASKQSALISSTMLASTMQDLLLFSLFGSPGNAFKAIKTAHFINKNRLFFYFRCLKQYIEKNLSCNSKALQ